MQTKRIQKIKEDKAIEFAKSIVKKIQNYHNMWLYQVSITLTDKDSDPLNDGRDSISEIRVDDEYLKATLIIPPLFIKRLDEGRSDELERILCHEMAHIYTSPLDRAARSRYTSEENIRIASEQTTEIMGRMMYDIIKLRENKNDTSTNRPNKRKG